MCILDSSVWNFKNTRRPTYFFFSFCHPGMTSTCIVSLYEKTRIDPMLRYNLFCCSNFPFPCSGVLPVMILFKADESTLYQAVGQ